MTDACGASRPGDPTARPTGDEARDGSDASATSTWAPVRDRAGGRWAVHGLLGAALAGRALVAHLTLPLLVVLEGSEFLPLLLARPSEATLVIGGAQARNGLIAWPLLVTLAVVGAVASDALSYAAGRRWGERALRRLVRHDRSHRGPSRIGRVAAWSERLMARSAPLAVALGRPTVLTHSVTPVLAGTAGLRLRVFLAASTVGALAWVAVWVAGGAALGALWQASKPVTLVALLAVAAATLVGVVLRRRSARGGLTAE